MIKSGKGIASPFVEVEAVTCDVSNSKYQKYKTKTVSDNGFSPCWNEDCEFSVTMPELACLRFIVYDEDMFQDANAIGQNVYPLGTLSEPNIRNGYRSIPLKNAYNEPLELSSLLVHIDIKYAEGRKDKNFQGLQDLKVRLRNAASERDELIKDKVVKSKKGEAIDPAVDARLKELNATLHKLEDKIMANPIERAKSKHPKGDKKKVPQTH